LKAWFDGAVRAATIASGAIAIVASLQFAYGPVAAAPLDGATHASHCACIELCGLTQPCVVERHTLRLGSPVDSLHIAAVQPRRAVDDLIGRLARSA
jgi:hypothetical protein